MVPQAAEHDPVWLRSHQWVAWMQRQSVVVPVSNEIAPVHLGRCPETAPAQSDPQNLHSGPSRISFQCEGTDVESVVRSTGRRKRKDRQRRERESAWRVRCEQTLSPMVPSQRGRYREGGQSRRADARIAVARAVVAICFNHVDHLSRWARDPPRLDTRWVLLTLPQRPHVAPDLGRGRVAAGR